MPAQWTTAFLYYGGKRMPLTDERLSEMIRMLPKCGIVADIGTDHGRLGAQLLLTGKCGKVWFSDISAPSLEKARGLIARRGLQERAEFFVGDGARALPGAPDAAVIAGMGGETIAGILRGAGERLADSVLVLEPNVGAELVRRALMETGRRITDERVVRAARRRYVLIRAEKGEAAYTERDLIVGPVLRKEPSEAFREYAAFRLSIAKKALAGAEKSGHSEKDALLTEMEYWREIVEC